MKKKTYDNQSYQTIKELVKQENLSKAMVLVKRVLNEYPLDKLTRLEYIRLLKSNDDFEEALKQAMYLLEIIDQNQKDGRLYDLVLLELYNIYFCLGDYQRAYDYLPQVMEIKGQMSSNNLVSTTLEELFLKQRLGLLGQDETVEYQNFYLASQIIHYDEKEALNSIVKHHSSEYREDESIIIEDEINIETLFAQVKSLLPIAHPVSSNNLASIFYFDYPDISNVLLKEEYPYKYLKVVAFQDTLQIITMYPFFAKERMKIVNDLKEGKTKVKQMSQIEKFNARYQKK